MSLTFVLLAFLPTICFVGVFVALSIWLRLRTVHTGWIVVLWCAAGSLYFFAPAKLELLLNSPVYLPKRGQILDRQTGLGIPNVYVLAEGSLTEHVIHTGTNPEYRLMVTTDRDGNYYFPATREFATPHRNFWTTLLTGSYSHQWSITAVLPGYIESQDESSLIAPNGNANVIVFLDKSRPANSRVGEEIQISPIILERYSLSAAQAVAYYSRLTTVGAIDPTGGRASQYALNVDVVRQIATSICSQDQASLVDWGVVLGLTTFLGVSEARSDRPESMRARYLASLKESEPDAFRPSIDTPIFKRTGDHPDFAVKNVCNAISSSGIEP